MEEKLLVMVGLFIRFFSVDQTRKIGCYLTNKSIKAAVISDNYYYANYDAPSVWGEIKNFKLTTFHDVNIRAPKFSVLLEKKEQINVINELKCCSITYIDNGSGAVVSPLNISKGVAVKIMQKKIFKGSISIYIGNDYNDLPGFEVCDIKVAVANAEKDILNMADYIIGSNQNDGVARFINGLI